MYISSQACEEGQLLWRTRHGDFENPRTLQKAAGSASGKLGRSFKMRTPNAQAH